MLKDDIMAGAMAGIVAGLISEELSARQIMDSIVGGAEAVIENVDRQFRD